MSRRVLRHFVIVGGQPKTLTSGFPLHVAAARLGVGPDAQHIVEFWAEGDLNDDLSPSKPLPEERPRTFLVVGTGHPIPGGAEWRGTTDRTPEGLVWHLYELPDGAG